MKKILLSANAAALLAAIALMTSCGAGSGSGSGANSGGVPSGKTIASGPAGNNLTATISSAEGAYGASTDGSLRTGQQEFMLTFTDASGKPVDVGAVALNNHMAAMGSMGAMNDNAKLTTTVTPGVFKGKVNIDMAGEWQAQITYEGPAGKGSFSLPIVAK